MYNITMLMQIATPSRQLYRFIVQLDQQENILKTIQILGVETMSLQAH